MKSFFEKLNIFKSSIELGSERKRVLREKLIHRIESSERANNIGRLPIQKTSFINYMFNPVKPMPMFAMIAIFALLGGGTSLAAESALPGDILYPVKVKINEQVVAAISVTASSKAKWDAQRATRRLEEVIALADKGEISENAIAQLEINFETHADRVNDRIEEIKTNGDIIGAADIASRFETSLKAHNKILARFDGASEENIEVQTGLAQESVPQIAMKALVVEEKTEIMANASSEVKQEVDVKKEKEKLKIGKFEAKVRSKIKTISKTRIKLESEIASSSASTETNIKFSAEGKIRTAENVVASTKSFIENQKASLGSNATVQAEARLAVANDLIIKAKAKVTANAYGEAFNIANHAIRVAQEARVLIQASARMNVDFDGGHSYENKSDDDSEGVSGEVRGESRACAQVITEAKNPKTGKVKTFSTPCDVPEGWVKIEGNIGVEIEL